MNTSFVALWSIALVLWVYALVPFTKLKRYLTQQRRDGLAPPNTTDLGQMRLILRDTRHPLHKQARRMMAAYGGFLFCWIAGFGLSMISPSPH